MVATSVQSHPPAPLKMLALAAIVLQVVVLSQKLPWRDDTMLSWDFAQYYVVSDRVLRGIPLYAPLATDEALQTKVGFALSDRLFTVAPPAFAVSVAPLSLLPYRTCWWVLILCSTVGIPWCVFSVAKRAGLSREWSSVWAAYTFASTPLIVYLALNRVETLTLLLAIFGWMNLRRGKEVVAGLSWGFCAAFKLFPLFWLAGLFVSGRSRTALLGIATALLLTLGASFVIGFDQVETYARSVFQQSGRFQMSPGNHSLVSLSRAFLPTTLAWALLSGLSITLLLLTTKTRDPDTLFTTCCATSLFLFPLCWSYYLVFVYPCIAIASSHCNLSRGSHRALFAPLLLLFFWPGFFGGFNGLLEFKVVHEGLFNYLPTLLLLYLAILPHTKLWLPNSRTPVPLPDESLRECLPQ